MKLTLGSEENDKISYEPSSTGGFNRTQTRLLKGRIQRPAADKEGIFAFRKNPAIIPKTDTNPLLVLAHGIGSQIVVLLNS